MINLITINELNELEYYDYHSCRSIRSGLDFVFRKIHDDEAKKGDTGKTLKCIPKSRLYAH